MTRIRTTHVGSLPRPDSLLAMMRARHAGNPCDVDELEAELRVAVMEVVARQTDLGIDIVSDGEFSKPSYATYVTERLSGFAGEFRGHAAQDLREYPELAKRLIEIGSVVPSAGGACCRGPVRAGTTTELMRDLETFAAAVARAKPHGAFVNAAAPGVIAVFQKNEYYPSEDDYIEAVAEAMRPEYEAIVAAGFLLQLDSPDLAMGRHLAFKDLDEDQFLWIAARNVAALNEATRNIPAERMRMHLCWGNYPGPHHRDIPLDRIIGTVLKARPKYLLLEGANPRHAHEWEVFRSVELPEAKVLIPGVVDSTSNYIEHPDLVAQRIRNYVHLVGTERVMAGTDCGFSTFSGYPTVHPDVVWAKLVSLVEGARRVGEKR